nr:MAG: nonstructural protein 2 [Protoparvovirus sp.]
MLCKIECLYSIATMLYKTVTIILERANRAVNAVIAQQAAAARMMMASQALQTCREQNNPYLPGNSLFGPTLSTRWGPDPCLTQEKELAAATTAHEEAQATAQISAAPTPQSPHAALAPQLSSTFDLGDELNPAVPVTEFITPDPSLNNMWSPKSIEDVMIAIAAEMEQQTGTIDEDELERLHKNVTILYSWIPQKGVHRKKRYKFEPNNLNWIGVWVPK